MRNLRWAAELAISDDDSKSALGVLQLNALGDSELLDDAQQLFVDAALRAVVEDPADLIDEAGEEAEVVRAIDEVPEDLEETGDPDVASRPVDQTRSGSNG